MNLTNIVFHPKPTQTNEKVTEREVFTTWLIWWINDLWELDDLRLDLRLDPRFAILFSCVTLDKPLNLSNP